ncbi:TPA: hypothetical protein DIC20_04025 [Candidatus Dependentiae bacterium]|nr:MAG: hypothetical protein US03_C0004G0093 [candidate division TM6 bacterium GW2011_GWF2_36_131]KKQ03271.1 MAG: hypothetical protein US13_C0004G0093 [candidate division TM6 bacterium GW2011_GWE2_36_25]KKQ19193.1 MAG: hypothetical protein US32_C0014G0014 [candidate division TM6 bacterium GW2011_GWA2_36_9]HBR70300.1 hypothetical protein [Candidatus Dependentiae bacterium]HCU00845.1 hypothetical protein [Candidatus Dependentiae bacterium]
MFKFNVLFLSAILVNISLCAYEAVVIEPIIDVVKKNFSTPSPEKLYYALPNLWHTKKEECPRLHQLLYNHRVFVLEEDQKQAKISIPHLIVKNKFNKKDHLKGWILKSEIRKIDELNQSYIPPFLRKDTTASSVVTLIFPWQNPHDKKLYSAGTRFVRSYQDTATFIGAYWFDFENNRKTHILLPVNQTLVSTERSFSEKQRLMIQLINHWVDAYGIIPYVWGGASIGNQASNSFYLTANPMLGKNYKGWLWPHQSYPYAGLDCSGLILLAAQIVELPYFCKNSSTIFKTLRPINKDEIVEDGDIIWMPGHVMIVSDVINNELIEAQGYWPSVGRVRRQKLFERFKNINAYDDFALAFFNKKPLERIHADRSIQTFTDYALLKFSSISL